VLMWLRGHLGRHRVVQTQKAARHGVPRHRRREHPQARQARFGLQDPRGLEPHSSSPLAALAPCGRETRSGQLRPGGSACGAA